MLKDPSTKYKPFKPVDIPDRTWPSRQITAAPRWLSSDLRDGNQALVNPMTVEQKTRFFNLLVKCGYKEIEVSYPAASDTDFNFTRMLIDRKLGVAEGVWLQVLSPAREDLIRRTFEAVRGAPRVIFHMYNATSPCFRSVVFNNDKPQTVDLALRHVKLIRELVDESIARGDGTEWQFEYSPETFSQTEEDFAYHICNQVQDMWFADKDRSKMHPIIFNLPATVEISTPNHYADQIEYFCRHLADRKTACISLHCHNDRGCATAATELGILAGAQRVEGCLFGNGERTGNVDLVQVALNLYTQGISPNVDFSDLQSIIDIATECNELPVHPRHPYAGDLVFCAFSGSHQDAIKKGFAAYKRGGGHWEIPYLPIDPQDLGCTYEAVIRVNSQSGKGGVSYIVQERLDFDMPRKMQIAFYQVIQAVADRTSKELSQDDIERIFRTTYHIGEGYQGRIVLLDYSLTQSPNNGPGSSSASLSVRSPNGASGGFSFAHNANQPGVKNRYFTGKILDGSTERTISGLGNGPISSLLDALRKDCDIDLSVREFSEAAIGQGSDTRAASYVELVNPAGKGAWGVGDNVDSTSAILQAVLSAVNAHVTDMDELVDEAEANLSNSQPPAAKSIPIMSK
ncbi:hypothetical protein EMMF5_003153 [Cystobasidiomycetes sp. EMM_F5]